MANNRNFEIVNERSLDGLIQYDFVCGESDEQFTIEYTKSEITVIEAENCSDQVMDKNMNFSGKLNNICQCLSSSN